MSHGHAAPDVDLPPLTAGPDLKRIGLISAVASFGGIVISSSR